MATGDLQYKRILSLDIAKDDNFEILELKRELEQRAAEHTLKASGSFRIPAQTTKQINLDDIVTVEVMLIELEAGQAVDIRINDPGIRAIGSIVVVAVVSLLDGEIFTISDGENTPVVFEYDVNGTGVTAGRRRVNVSAVTTSPDVALITALAIEQARVDGVLDIAASADGVGAAVILTASLIGSQANVAITESVADAGFVVAGMAGGSAFPVKLQPVVATGGTPIFLNEGLEATRIELRNPNTGGEACGKYFLLGRVT